MKTTNCGQRSKLEKSELVVSADEDIIAGDEIHEPQGVK